jgi:hypothetical protein
MEHRKNSACGRESPLGGNKVVGGLEGEPADAALTLTLRINTEEISTRFIIYVPQVFRLERPLAFLQ